MKLLSCHHFWNSVRFADHFFLSHHPFSCNFLSPFTFSLSSSILFSYLFFHHDYTMHLVLFSHIIFPLLIQLLSLWPYIFLVHKVLFVLFYLSYNSAAAAMIILNQGLLYFILSMSVNCHCF
jgi:hypothetical protein